MSDWKRLASIFTFNLLALALVSSLNHAYSASGVYVRIDALLVLFTGLFIYETKGLMLVLLLGILAHGHAPIDTYIIPLGYIGLWAFFVACRLRIRRDNPNHLSAVAVLGQTLYLIYGSLLLSHELGWHSQIWTRTLAEGMVAGFVAFLLAPIWCRWQKHLLSLQGWNPDSQLSKA